MKKMKVYPIHPCTICAELTTNKNLCQKHLNFAMHPSISQPSSRLTVYGDIESAGGRRRESVNKMR